MKISKIEILVLAFSLVLTACSSDDKEVLPPEEELGAYHQGIFVTNEGPFNNGTGTLTYLSKDFATVENNVYFNVNEENLGNIVQSMTFGEEEAFIIVSNAHKIIVVNSSTLEQTATITDGLNNPRYGAYYSN